MFGPWGGHRVRIGLVCGLAAVVVLALPVRYQVAGLSMAPCFMPGDVVATGLFPWIDRWRVPRRHACWTCRAPDGTTAIKRVAAAGGQKVAIVDGDLSVDGRVDPPPPGVFFQRACVVGRFSPEAFRTDGLGGKSLWTSEGIDIFDDAPFAPDERRLLLPVRDVGVAVITRHRSSARAPPIRSIIVGVGERSVAFRCPPRGRYMLLAGRLDGHLVASAWPIPQFPLLQQIPQSSHGRLDADASRQLPIPGVPDGWRIVSPWEMSADASTPTMTVRCPSDESALATATECLESIIVWRDVHHRPPADGAASWELRDDEFFLLGDFPSGSVDSRRWGPLPRTAMLHEIRP